MASDRPQASAGARGIDASGASDARARWLRPYQQSIEAQEHYSNVLRMRKMALIGLWGWPCFGILDWFVGTFLAPGTLTTLLAIRALGMVPVLVGAWLLFREPPVSERVVRGIDIGAFTIASLLISWSCVVFRGIDSPFAIGVLVLLVCRSVIVADDWRRAIGPITAIALAHPLGLAAASLRVPAVAAQFHDAHALAGFALNEFFIVATAAMTLAGGHAVWTLRRRVFEARAIGRYRLKRRIGSGGMGEVWAAYHPTLQREVALKILKPDRRLDETSITRFKREVRATTELSHPNTVRVFDYGVTADGLWYYAMEMLEGDDLATVLKKEGPLAPERAAALVWQAAKALGEAHARGIVHRDIKPANIFVTELGGEPDFVKVLDFGAARFAASDGVSLTQTGFAVGTPLYTAPEVAMGGSADPRSDVYALGAVLYTALCARPPFEYRDVRRALTAHVHDTPLRPSEKLGQPIPSELESIVLRCLAKNPDHRYADAGSLSADLAGWISTLGSGALPISASTGRLPISASTGRVAIPARSTRPQGRDDAPGGERGAPPATGPGDDDRPTTAFPAASDTELLATATTPRASVFAATSDTDPGATLQGPALPADRAERFKP